MDQIEVAYSTLLSRPAATPEQNTVTQALAKDGKAHPRVLRC